ncbi:hypothetical protein [Rhodopseudomonas palustris]|uniref:hypothetical protein n=1 Tax=Rhodopseudomonas palustris TaxID=1076 RepID=UPI001F1F2C17|nr:hypothetical protein [Rhodopseudomonas palustris]
MSISTLLTPLKIPIAQKICRDELMKLASSDFGAANSGFALERPDISLLRINSTRCDTLREELDRFGSADAESLPAADSALFEPPGIREAPAKRGAFFNHPPASGSFSPALPKLVIVVPLRRLDPGQLDRGANQQSFKL